MYQAYCYLWQQYSKYTHANFPNVIAHDDRQHEKNINVTVPDVCTIRKSYMTLCYANGPRGKKPQLCRSRFLSPAVLLQMPLFIIIIIMCQGVDAIKKLTKLYRQLIQGFL